MGVDGLTRQEELLTGSAPLERPSATSATLLARLGQARRTGPRAPRRRAPQRPSSGQFAPTHSPSSMLGRTMTSVATVPRARGERPDRRLGAKEGLRTAGLAASCLALTAPLTKSEDRPPVEGASRNTQSMPSSRPGVAAAAYLFAPIPPACLQLEAPQSEDQRLNRSGRRVRPARTARAPPRSWAEQLVSSGPSASLALQALLGPALDVGCVRHRVSNARARTMKAIDRRIPAQALKKASFSCRRSLSPRLRSNWLGAHFKAVIARD